jgi:hypothetical protein
MKRAGLEQARRLVGRGARMKLVLVCVDEVALARSAASEHLRPGSPTGPACTRAWPDAQPPGEGLEAGVVLILVEITDSRRR